MLSSTFIDELGYLNLKPEQSNIFFKLMEERYRQHATIITTNLDYDEWPNFLGNRPMVEALLSRLRASSIQRRGMTRGIITASSTIMIAPPTNSASANCHPISSHNTMPSSTTRLVEANMKTIDVVKSAPRANSDLLNAAAANEHDEDTIPRNPALATVAGR